MELISVVMSVYNGQEYLEESVESILKQSYRNFEFIIINDGSTDLSSEILRTLKDKRIKLINNDGNIGLTASLNKGLAMARGTYVARMDADDISLPQRFQLQVDFLDRHPETAMVGTWAKFFGEEERRVMRFPRKSSEIQAELLFNNAFCHPSVMFRRSLLENFSSLYRDYKGNRNFEDYNAWISVTEVHPTANLPKVLLKYRRSLSQITSIGGAATKNAVQEFQIANFEKKLFELNTKQKELIKGLREYELKTGVSLASLQEFFDEIMKCNRTRNSFDQSSLGIVLGRRLLWLLRQSRSPKDFWNLPLEWKTKVLRVAAEKVLLNLFSR